MQTCVWWEGKSLPRPEASSLRFTFWARLKIKALLPSSSLTEHNPITPRRTCTTNQGGRKTETEKRERERQKGMTMREAWREGWLGCRKERKPTINGGEDAEGEIDLKEGWEEQSWRDDCNAKEGVKNRERGGKLDREYQRWEESNVRRLLGGSNTVFS